MSAQAVASSRASIGYGSAPRYLRAVVAVARTPRRGEWAIVHLGSGKFFRTDELGATLVRAMIDGRSDIDTIAHADRSELGGGARARQLIDGLAATGALTWTPPPTSTPRWRLRRIAALAIGLALDTAGRMVPLMPVFLLAWMFRWLPRSPFTVHVWRSGRATILENLRASGYAHRSERWLTWVGRGCAAFAPINSAFMYVGAAVAPAKTELLADQLIDAYSADHLARELAAKGPAIGAFLHCGTCAAVPNVLRNRGVAVVRAVVPEWHGAYVSRQSGAMTHFWGDEPSMTVSVSDPLATASLVRHLKAGRSVYIALDRLAFERPTATAEMLGHSFPRNDGPAWLAVRSGRPVSLWTTHESPSGAIISASPLLYPDPSLPANQRVAALSAALYQFAEAAIRDHPEGWACWSYLALGARE